MMNFSRIVASLILLGVVHAAHAQIDSTPQAAVDPVVVAQAAPVSAQPMTSAAVPTPVSVPVTDTNIVLAQTSEPPRMTPAQFRQWLSMIKEKRRRQQLAVKVQHKQRMPAPPPITFEQGQQIMLNSVPKSSIPPVEDSSDAFNAMLQQNMPLTPQQVVKLHQQVDLSQRASAVSPNIPPKSVSSTVMVNLAPGAAPPAVRLAQGYVTSLVFVDSTGTPWPIASFDVGNPKAVNMQWDGKTNILLIQAVAPYTTGDIVVRLVGLPTPITLELVSGQRVVDYRVDLHVAGIGPNTKELPIGTDLPNSANQLLLGVLDGVAPPGSRALNVNGASNTQVWQLGEKMYLRTRLTVLSPGWVGKMVSPDGMNAYELPKTSSVLVSRYGEPVQLKIEGF